MEDVDEDIHMERLLELADSLGGQPTRRAKFLSPSCRKDRESGLLRGSQVSPGSQTARELFSHACGDYTQYRRCGNPGSKRDFRRNPAHVIWSLLEGLDVLTDIQKNSIQEVEFRIEGEMIW